MRLGFAFIANAGESTPNGRFSVLGGGTDGFLIGKTPTTIPALALVFELRFRPEDCGRDYRMRIGILAPSGSEEDTGANHSITPAPDPYFPTRDTTAYVVAQIVNWEVRETGVHRFRYYVNDSLVGEIECGIIIPEKPPASEGG